MIKNPKDQHEGENLRSQQQNQGSQQNKRDRNSEDNTVLKKMNKGEDEKNVRSETLEEVHRQNKEKQIKTPNTENCTDKNEDHRNDEDNTVLKKMNKGEDEKNVYSEMP